MLSLTFVRARLGFGWLANGATCLPAQTNSPRGAINSVLVHGLTEESSSLANREAGVDSNSGTLVLSGIFGGGPGSGLKEQANLVCHGRQSSGYFRH